EPGRRDARPAFAEFFQRNEPLCGRLQQDKLDALFGARASEAHSSLLLAVGDVGMLAVGSHDTHRLRPGLGTVVPELIAQGSARAKRIRPCCCRSAMSACSRSAATIPTASIPAWVPCS